MPIIIDHTPDSSKLLNQFATNYATRVLQRQREGEALADQGALDTMRTDNNIRQQRAAADYQLQTAPAQTAADVARARAMAPVALEGYKARETFDQQLKQGAVDKARMARESVFDKTISEMHKGGMPEHVRPWMVALARADFADGKLDKGTYDLLRPRTAKELADERYLDAERSAKLRALERADSAPADAARFYRELRGSDGTNGPVDPHDELIARGLESGGFKLNDPAVRARIGLLTPGEEASSLRAERTGGSEGRLAQAELRHQIDADPTVQAAKMQMQAATRTRATLHANPNASPKKKADADAAAEAAMNAYVNAALGVSARLGMPGVLPPEATGASTPAPAAAPASQPTKNQMDADRLLQSFVR